MRLRRLALARERIRKLDTDNKRLRHALAEALGVHRAQHPITDNHGLRYYPSPARCLSTRSDQVLANMIQPC